MHYSACHSCSAPLSEGQARTTEFTVHQNIRTLPATFFAFSISTPSNPGERFSIQGDFTADQFRLAEYTYSVSSLQDRYKHLKGIPIQQLSEFALAGPCKSPPNNSRINSQNHSVCLYPTTHHLQNCTAKLKGCGRWTSLS